MAPRTPDLSLLRTFRAVATEGSFTRAANALNLTQSAVSHHIRRLEREVGKVLFVRNPHQVHITKSGSELLTALGPALDHLDNIFSHPAVRSPITRLAIELESGFASSWLTPRLSTFTAMHPDVRLHLNISQQGVEFSGETEIAVKWGSGYWPGFEVEWLMEAPLVPMCAPSILRTRKLRTPNDLTHHVLLHDRQLTHWTIWAQVAKVSGLDTTAGHIFQDTLALEQAAIRGHGIALYCMELGRGALERGDLVIPLPDHSITGLGDYFLVMQRKRLSTVATDFIKWLRAVIAAEKRPMQLAEPSKKIGERAYVVGSLEGSAYGKYIKSTNSTKPASRQRI